MPPLDILRVPIAVGASGLKKLLQSGTALIHMYFENTAHVGGMLTLTKFFGMSLGLPPRLNVRFWISRHCAGLTNPERK